MASSNRHWPSMFKSKPNHHHQWQHDINDSPLLSSSGPFQKTIYTSSGSVCEERSPEPKPRWNPRPEQIRILEAIFNSGMVNPPRDEIRKIRAQLQEYGQVGDANVFYWFQNRKSRSKHKQRHLQSARSQARAAAMAASAAGPTSSSSSSSGSPDKLLPMVAVGPTGLNVETTTSASVSSPTASVNQAPLTEFLVEPFYPQGAVHGFGFAPFPDQFGISVGPAMWGDLVLGQEGSKNGFGLLLEENKVDNNNKLQNPNPNPNPNPNAVGGLGLGPADGVGAAASAVTVGVQVPFSEIQVSAGVPELGIGGAARSMVFINEVAFEVVSGPLNVREAFGEEAVLIHSSGHPVLTDQWGLTLHPLQHGASYYLV